MAAPHGAPFAEMGASVEVADRDRGKPPRPIARAWRESRAEARLRMRCWAFTPHFLGLPAAELDGIAHADLNAAIAKVIEATMPDTA